MTVSGVITCTCDECGAQRRLTHDGHTPEGWIRIQVRDEERHALGRRQWDFCPRCKYDAAKALDALGPMGAPS